MRFRVGEVTICWVGKGRNYMPSGALPLGPLAMTCFAYNAEFPTEIESDYLPKRLVQRTWLGEFLSK